MSSIKAIALAKMVGGEGGGGDTEIIALNVNQNGTYNPGSGKAYKPVNVNVPNSYAAGDEGKVVQNGALVSQTSRTVTANGTVDTTTNDEVAVEVSPNLQSKTVTENGTVTPDQGYDGLSSVVVNVSGGSEETYFKRLTPIHSDVVGGYIGGGTWNYGDNTARTDVYQVEAGKRYLLMTGLNPGNRFRTAFYTTDIAQATQSISGVAINNDDSPMAYMLSISYNRYTLYVPPQNGYIGYGKTSESIDGIQSYVFEALF